jgi:glycosyltransferase involved in cell wall biosynthesis
MNILIANSTWYASGGDWTYINQLIHLYERNGHVVVPFSMHDSRNFETPYSSYFVDNIDYKELNTHKSLKNAFRVLRRSIYSGESARNLERLLKTIPVDIAHLNNIHHYLTSSIVKVLNARGIPILWTIHDYSLICPENSFISHGDICERCRNGRFYMCAIHRCKKNSFSASMVASLENYSNRVRNINKGINAFICPSKFVYSKFIENGYELDKLFQVYHCFDRNTLAKHHHRNNGLPQRYVIYIGRMESIKGVMTLLKAFSTLKHIPLVMIGFGSLEEKITNIIHENQLQNIYFVGKKNISEVFDILKQAEFSVCPSEWYELLGYSIIESMIMSKPVIGTRLGAIPELVIDHKTGLTFEAGNETDLKDKIQFLWNNPALTQKLGRFAKRHVQTLTDPEQHYQELLNIITRIKNNRT